MYRVIIDSNVWVSFLIGKSLKNLLQYIRSEKIIIVTCDEQLQELANTFQKPKLQKYFQAHQTASFLAYLKGLSVIVPISAISPLCRDPNDDYLLALSVASKAHYLVTGDADLLILQQVGNTVIIKYADFDVAMNREI